MDEMEMNISAYGRMRKHLESRRPGKWVVFHGEKLAGTSQTRREAAEDAKMCFGHGPYLIAQVGSKWIDESVRDLQAKAANRSRRIHGAGNRVRGIGSIDAHLLSSVIVGGSAFLWTGDRRLERIAGDLDVAFSESLG